MSGVHDDDKSEAIKIHELEDLTNDHEFLKPIFQDRQQILEYDALLTLKNVVLPQLEELKIKKSHIMGAVSLKLSKLLLSMLMREPSDLSTSKVGSSTRIRLL